MVSRSDAHAQRRVKSFQSRLDKAGNKLSKIKVKSDDTADSFRMKAENILKACDVEDMPSVPWRAPPPSARYSKALP